MKKRFYELDALRGIAALMVVLYHYTKRYDEIYTHKTMGILHFDIGRYGIQLFFMISGFVIFMTINKTEKIKDFVISRFSRLYPAYWFAVILTYSATLMIPLPGRMVGLSEALINLSMFQTWFRIPNVDGVYWTLAIELSFYIIMCLLYVSGYIKKIVTVSIIWMVIILLTNHIENYYGYKVHAAVKLALILDYGHLFIAGIMFYKLYEDKKLKYLFCIAFSYMVEYKVNSGFLIISGVYFLLFCFLVLNLLSWLKFKPLVFLGAISYSLYLIHQNVGYIIIRVLYDRGINNPYLIILIPIVMTIIVAFFMNILVEKPSMRLIRVYYSDRGGKKN